MNNYRESGLFPQPDLPKADPVRLNVEALVAVVLGHHHLRDARLDGFIVEGHRKKLFGVENRLHPIFSLTNPFLITSRDILTDTFMFVRYGMIDQERGVAAPANDTYYASKRVYFTLNPDLQPVVIQKNALALDVYWLGMDKDQEHMADTYPLYLVNQYTPRIENMFAFRDTSFLLENEVLPVDTLIERLGLDKTDTDTTIAALSHYGKGK